MLHKNKKITVKLCGILTAAACILSTASGTVFAQTQLSPAADRVLQSEIIYGKLDLNEEPPISVLSLKPNNTFTGTLYYNQLDEVSQDIYNLLYAEYKNGGHGESIELFSVFEKHSTTNYSNFDEASSELSSHIYTAFYALSADHPECSWISYTLYGFNFSCVPKGSGISLISVPFLITEGYNYGTSGEINSAVSKAKSEIGTLPDRYEQVVKIHEYICTITDYNYTAIEENLPDGYDIGWYQTAYSAFYPVSENNETKITTVCAGYSKAFKILCDTYGIPCVTVRGTADGVNHMWNYVQMENGVWYAVDATWDDQTEDWNTILTDFLLVGGNSIPTNFTEVTFNQSHIGSGNWNGTGYFFAYPQLSDNAYEPSKQITLTDGDGSGISVTGTDDILDENVTLNVKKLDEDSNEVTFDITLTLNGKAYQPDGNVSVKIPVPEGFDASECKVYYKDSDGNYTDMNAVVSENYLVFSTNHFSEYVITAKELAPKGILGDINNDKKVTIADARMLLQAASGSRELTEEQRAVADVNGDGKITIADARWLLQVASGSRVLGN